MSHTTHPQEDIEQTLDTINKRTGRNIVQAVGTGALLVVLVICSLIFNTQIYLWVVILFVCIALWELRVDFATIGIRIPVVTLWIMAALTFASIYYLPTRQHSLVAAVGCIISAAVVALVATIVRPNHERVERAVTKKLAQNTQGYSAENPSDTTVNNTPSAMRLTNVGASLFAVFYLIVLGSFIVLPVTRAHPVAYEFMIIFLPSLGDIGGLAFGASFGKHKLSPRISPKKSIEGLLGSILLSTIGAVIIGFFSFDLSAFATHLWKFILLGVLVGIVGLFGDLCASMLKRDMGLKDMGHILAGHGGVLDRVDSILMCAPVISMLLMAFAL